MAGNTTFQVRLKANADPGSKSAKITVASSGAQSKEVTLSGTVSAVAPVWDTIPTQNTTVDDGVMADMTDYLSPLGSPAPTITVTSTGANTPTGEYEMDGTGFYFYTAAADAGKTFVFTFTASNAGGSPTATMTVNVAAGEYTWDGTGNGWYLKGDWNSWGTTHEMKTDADFGSGDYSRVTVNNASGTQTFKWHDGSSFWMGYYGNDSKNPAKNTVYGMGGGTWGGDFSSSFFTSGKYYTFRGKFYVDPGNSSERVNDFVIMETTGAPTEFVSAGAGNPSGTAAAGVAQTVSVTLNHNLNSEETVYVRYKAGDAAWTTVALTSGSGATRSGSIPAQTAGTRVEYYFLTTTVGKSTLDSNADLCTLNGLKNGANNWSYTATASAPTVGTPTRTATTAVGATLGGTVSATGGATVTSWGVVYSASSLNSNPTVGGTGCTNVTAGGTPGLGAFTAAVSGLKANTEYKWKAYAVNSAGTGYTTVQTFTTPCMSAGPVVTPEPGNSSATFTWDDVGAVRYLLSLWTEEGGETTETKTDHLTIEMLKAGGSGYKSFSGIQASGGSTAVYAGTVYSNKASGVTSISMNVGKGAGIQTTTSGGTLDSIAVTWTGSPNGWLVYGKTSSEGAFSGLDDTSGHEIGTLDASHQSLSGLYASGYSYVLIVPVNGTSLATSLDLTWKVSSSSIVKTYVSGYGAAGGEVTSGVTVSGLTPGTTYNWSLKAVGGGTGCEQDATAASGYNYTVTPTAADEAPVWGTIAAITRTLAQGQLSKDMAAELSTVGIPAPTFSVAMNTGSATPAGSYSVDRDSGVFTYTPALADAGKTFTFKFTASNSEGSPTQTMAVTVTAGSLTLTGSFSKFEAAAGAASLAQSVTLTGSNLGNGETVTVSVGSPFEVSLTGNDNDYASSKTVTASAAGAISSQTVYVRVASSASQGNNQTGTLQAYCTSAGGSGSAVTKSLTADVSGESTATAIERSYIVVNDGSGVEWFNGSGSGQTHSFSEYYLGEFTSLRLAAEASTRGDGSAAGHVVTMNYTVDTGTEGAWSTLTMPWKEWDDPLNKHQSHDGAGNLTYTPDLASGRVPGLYYIRVFFSQVTTGGTIYDSRNNLNYVASFRVPLTTPTISGVTSARVVSLSGKDAGATYVVVRKDSDTGWGTPSGGLPSAGATWCGGTVVYVGTDSSFTDTTAEGCAQYYYKAWTKSGSENVWSAGSASYHSPTMATPAAPVLAALSSVTYQGFTASWGSVAGATKYRVDVARSFAGTVTETFNDADLGSGTVSSYLDRTITGGVMGTWTATQCRIDQTKIDGKAPTIGAGGTLVSPALPSGCTQVSFQYAWPFSESGTVTIKLYDDDVEVGSQSISAASGGTATFTGLSIAAGSVVKFENTASSNKRILMDNITFSCSADYVAGWNNHDVGNVTSVNVTGLDELTTYYVRVKSEGSTGSCTSLWSNVESATTLQNDSVTSVTIANHDAAGESAGSNVAAGNVAAGQTVLVQGTKLTVAAGSVTPTLTGVTFTTTGTAGTGDVTTYRVRVGTSGTYAGNETEKGTVSCSGAATSHTVTFGSAQSLTPGQTYYVWIEAETKAGATGGHTVGVAALTGASFATTGARKSGETTATGLQTIGNLTAFEATTGSAQGGKVDLTWTAGASGSVLVRWSDVRLDAIPDPGTAWVNEATGLTDGSYTVTGLTGCKTYYFKAWEVIDGTACGTAQTDSADASAPAAPTGLGHGTPTAHEATLTWTAGAGAASHVIDLWHFDGASEGGGSGGISGIGGTYEMITSTNDLSDGNYVFVEAQFGTLAMNNDNTSTLLHSTSVAAMLSGEGNTILTLADTEESSNIVWRLAYDSSAENWTIQSVGNDKYVSWTSGNSVKLEDSLSDDYDRWTLVFSDGIVKPKNVGETSRVLQYNYNNGSDRFACYGNEGQQKLKLYKQTSSSGGGGGGSSGTKVDDIIAGVVQPESSVVVTNGATSVGLGHLTDGTTYYWTVKALGDGGCAGGVSSQDSFTTAMLLGVPTIVSPLTNGVEQISGAVTGKPGATVVLKRFESAELAGTGTAWGLSGDVVSVTETSSGSGVWTFTDAGLDGCKTYWYKAWQWEMIDGEKATSGASAVESAKTELGTPVVTAVGAGTQMTISWLEVPGASSYRVQITDTEGNWEAPSAGGTLLDEDFAACTGTSGAEVTVATTNGGTIASKWTHDPGWYGNTVYGSNGMVRIGKSGAPGLITTPKLSALANGGTLSFKLKKYGSDNNSLDVQICYDDGSDEEEWTSLNTFSPSTNWQDCQVTLSANASDFWICFETSAKRAWLDDIKVTAKASESSGGLVYDITVTDPPYERTKIGLELATEYWYRVTATNDEGGCSGVATGSAWTRDAAVIEVQPKHYNFGTVTKNEGAKTTTFTVRNRGNIPLTFTSVGLVQDGDAYSITAPANPAAEIGVGGSRTYTVQFNPTNSGTRTATLQFLCNAVNAEEVEGETYRKVEIPLTGICFDPATADPEVLWLSVKDGLGVENTVWDDSMAKDEAEDVPVLKVTAYHYNGMDSDTARWSLYDENGALVSGFGNLTFDSMTPTNYDGRSCSLFTAAIPALTAAKTYRGKYTVGVTLKDSSLAYTTTTTNVVPIGQEWLLDDFMRADAVGSGGGALGNSWVARASSGSLPGSAAIRNAALELYGPGGLRSGTQGRVAAGRDMSDEGYPTDWTQFTSAGSWGFHFKTGAKTVSWADGSTAGAFVLGATHVAWFTAENAQKGVAVMLTNNCVRLARFEKSLLAGGTITDLTTNCYNGTQGKWLAIRVDYLPGQEAVDEDESDDGQAHASVPAKMRLYVKEVTGPGGNPVEECGNADLVETVDVGDAVSGNLKFGGPVWNHGTAQLSETTGGTFDDLYVPHMDGQGEPMVFHVIDEDTDAPEFYDFSIRGAFAALDLADYGLVVTGYVHEASGIASGSVSFTVYDGDDVLMGPEPMSVSAVEGSSTEFKLVGTIPDGVIDSSLRSTACRFVVTATDGDDDRSVNGSNIDSLTGTGSFPFTLCDSTPTAPEWATAEIDGAEMVVLRWARTAGARYVVVRSDTEIGENASPQGRTDTMDEGTSVAGWGKVVYNGTGDEHLTGTWTAREFVVGPGSTNYFAVYGMTGTGGEGGTGFYFSAPTKPNAYAWATTNASGVVTQHTATESGTPVSSAVAAGAWPCVTRKYEPGEGVDSFAYRTSVAAPGDDNPQRLALPFNYEFDSPRPETGSGWGGPWTGTDDDLGKWKVHDGNLETWKTHFPTPAANKLYWEDTSTVTSASAELYRPLAATNTSGKFFVAGMMNYGGGLDASMFDTAGTWMSIALVDENGDVLVSFGKQGGGTLKDATIQVPVGQFGITGSEAGEYRNNGGEGGYYTLNPGHGQDYILAGEVDRDEKLLRMWVFYAGRTAAGETDVEIPQVWDDPDNTVEKPSALESVQASWSWEGTAPNWAGKIAGIKLIAGSDNSHQLGHVYFDEIRFAQTWQELFLFNDPEVYTYDFDKPETGTGRLDPLKPEDAEGHKQWQISDGALAHGDVGLNAQFGLYHRTGIQTATFTIKDENGTNLLKTAATSGTNTTASVGGTSTNVILSGLQGAAYSDWKTPAGGAMNVAVPTNWISLDSNYVVEVTLTSAGGRQAVVTAASETGGGGATDLFFGEYGEGRYWDKYIELYNGTGHDIDLYDYYIFRPENASSGGNDFSSSYDNLIPHNTTPFARICPDENRSEHVILQHKETIVLLNNKENLSGDNLSTRNNRLRELTAALTRAGARYILMTNEVLDAGGKVPYLLVKAEDFDEATVMAAKGRSGVSLNWLDACGNAANIIDHGASEDGKFIMSRKESATHLPRSKPYIIDESEWEYRDWCWPTPSSNDDYDTTPKYTNLVATAGQYDRNIGLGGNMEFKVYDDDVDAPVLSEGGVKIGSDARLTGETGDRTYVMGGWSFTNYPAAEEIVGGELSLEQYQWITEMWPYGMTRNGGVSWSPLLGGDDLDGYKAVIEAGNNKGQSNAEFDGISQRKYGCMVAHASSSFAKSDEVWLGFDLDVSKLSDAVLTFGYAGGSAGFANARVEVSTTGLEGTFIHPTGWEFTANDTGGASTWTEWSGDLTAAAVSVPEIADAGHLWFRVVLKDYGTASGTFRLDNIRLEGAPELLRVSDAEMNTVKVVFDAKVSDPGSGLDTNTAVFTCGVADPRLTEARSLVSGGKSASTFTWTKPATYSKARVQDWYTNSVAGRTQLRLTIADKDDDRPGDATTMTADFGTLDVYDDDVEPPTLEMASMKPRKDGTMAKWLLMEKTQTASEVMEGLNAGWLGLNTTAGTTSKPRYSIATNEDIRAYAVYQSGWQAESKFWTATIKNTTAGAGTISKVRFWSKVGSVLAPTGYRIESGTVTSGVTGETTERGSDTLLTRGDAWVKEGAEGATGSPIQTWVLYEKDVDIPLAAGQEIEVRIFGTGTDPDGIGATWYLWGLEFMGTLAVPGEGGEDGYTYVTDSQLSGGATLPMSGYLWDVSGLLSVPTYALTNAATGVEISSGSIEFTSEGEPSTRTTRALGEFSQEITVSSMGYTGVQLVEYKGGIHAEDADNDRNSKADGTGTYYDTTVLDGQFAFTVIDQDLAGPTAPTNVTVNGVAVPNTAPTPGSAAWNDAPWTNKPEFLVTFDVAKDLIPTVAELGDTNWLALHGIPTNGAVMKASMQTGAAGIGEYRVALETNALALSNAPAFSVAVTNGAIANYGFERYGNNADETIGWRISNSNDGIGSSPAPYEGTNCVSIGKSAASERDRNAHQIIVCEMGEATTVTVEGTMWYYKNTDNSRAHIYLEAFTDEELTQAVSCSGDADQIYGNAVTQKTWTEATVAPRTFTAPAGTERVYLRVLLYATTAECSFDDVRLSVRVGAAPAAGTPDKGTMRYKADASGQGLGVKYLFAADADNNRAQDRMMGETAVFYTPYDCTPPTPVGISKSTGASTETVDDPTTQFDLTWSTGDVGPDDPDSANYTAIPEGIKSAAAKANNVLSPWGSYKIYFSTFDPDAWKKAGGSASSGGTGTTGRRGPREGAVTYASLDEWIDGELIIKKTYTNWSFVTKDSSVEDPSAAGANYNALGTMSTWHHRLYDLDFDQDYVVVIVGVDKAGNEGPASATSWATNNTIKFAITQGVMRAKADIPEAWWDGLGGAKKAAALYWTASASDGEVKRTYDLIYRDARSFSESSNNTWTAVGTVQSNWFADAGALEHSASQIRFYRAAYEDRWKDKVEVGTSGRREMVAQRPLMSEDVYAMTAVPLVQGANFVALHGFGVATMPLPNGEPNAETNTLGAIFGTDPKIWPVGADNGVKLDVYTAGFTAGHVTPHHTYYLDTVDGKTDWYLSMSQQDRKIWTHYVDPDIFRHGVSIVMPEISESQRDLVISNNGTNQNAMYWHPLLMVPTNTAYCQSLVFDRTGAVVSNETVAVDFSVPVTAGSPRTGVEWNFCSFTLPVAFHPSQLGLETAGFGAAPGVRLTQNCDILYAYDSVTKSLRPGSGMFLGHASTNSTELVWRSILGNNPVVTGKPFYPNDVLVINTRSGGSDWIWTYHPTNFYTPPTRWGGW